MWSGLALRQTRDCIKDITTWAVERERNAVRLQTIVFCYHRMFLHNAPTFFGTGAAKHCQVKW